MGLALDDWHKGGERVPLQLPGPGGRTVEIFIRREADDGGKPWLTLLHGFPTSSWDWARVAPLLSARFRLLMFDFLGFGNSDKPKGHRYSIAQQADLVQEIWRWAGVLRTWLVAHDYGDNVAAELLARAAERGSTEIQGGLLLNGGLYGDLNHPLLIQRLLRMPGVGAVVTRLISEAKFQDNFRRVFSDAGMPSPEAMHDHWRAIALRQGNHSYHRLMHFYGDQERDGARWEGALERSTVPLALVWGMDDLVSTPATAQRLKTRNAKVQVTELAGVRHYPHLEAPEPVAEAIRRHCTASGASR